MQNPDLFVRVSTDAGHLTMPRASFERAGSAFRELKQPALDGQGRPLPLKPRLTTSAETPTEPETVSGDDTIEETE